MIDEIGEFGAVFLLFTFSKEGKSSGSKIH